MGGLGDEGSTGVVALEQCRSAAGSAAAWRGWAITQGRWGAARLQPAPCCSSPASPTQYCRSETASYLHCFHSVIFCNLRSGLGGGSAGTRCELD